MIGCGLSVHVNLELNSRTNSSIEDVQTIGVKWKMCVKKEKKGGKENEWFDIVD